MAVKEIPQSDLPPIRSATFLNQLSGNFKCGACAQCNFTNKCDSFYHPTTGQKFKIRGTITCKTTHVVYMIKCPCSLAYVGMTTRALKTRISEHRSDIQTGDMRKPVAAHFKQMSHNVSMLRYIGIERLEYPRRGGDRTRLLQQRETFWIHKLKTLQPHGMHLDFDIRPFL